MRCRIGRGIAFAPTAKAAPARFTIANASATVKDLPMQGGLSGTFTDQVSQQYDVALDAALEILDTRASRSAQCG